MEWNNRNAQRFEDDYGNEAMRELLINYVITGGTRESTPIWLAFCIKLKLCTKATKNLSLNMHHFPNGHVGNYHMIRIINGKGVYLFNINVLDTELQQYLGE